jgi:MurNAc alpha-1-phosphate uridylyltransferase
VVPELVAVVLAAGAGRRLRPLTDLRPKALCPVGNRPLVDLALERAGRHTAAAAVNVHHHRAQLEAHLHGRVHLSVEEPQALGTAGALGALRDWIDGRAVLVLNADAWHRDDLGALVEGWDGERARLLVVDDPARGDFGRWRFAGASLLPWRLVRTLRAEPSGLYEACWRALAERGALDFVTSAVPFVDCGTPGDYLRANLAASGGHSVIGEGVRIDGEVDRCVVWPGGVVARGERLVEAIRVGSDLTLTPFATPSQGQHWDVPADRRNPMADDEEIRESRDTGGDAPAAASLEEREDVARDRDELFEEDEQ